MRFNDVKNGSKSVGISTQNNSLSGGKSLNRRRFSRGAAAGLAAFACVAGFFGGASQIAQAEEPPTPMPPVLAVDIVVASDGTETWSQSAKPGVATDADNTIHETDGYDAGPNNGVIRVNDLMTYRVNYSVNANPANDVTLIITFPKGTYMDTLPTICGTGSAVTAMTLPTTITDDTFENLQQQTLTCKLGDYDRSNLGQSLFVSFTVKVLNAAANNQPIAFDPDSVKISGADTVTGEIQVVTDADPTTGIDPETKEVTSTTVLASSRLMWDLSIIGTRVASGTTTNINTDSAESTCGNLPNCVRIGYPMTFSVPVAGGKGAMPAVGDVTFTLDMSLDSLFPDLTSSQKAAIKANPTKYAPRLNSAYTVSTVFVSSMPASSITDSKATNDNAVRQSGTLTPAGYVSGAPITGPVTLQLSGTDWSLLTVPKTSISGTSLPDPNVSYAVSLVLLIVIPMDTFGDDAGNGFGTPSEDGGSLGLTLYTTFTSLNIAGLTDKASNTQATETISQQPASQTYKNGTWNDSQTATPSVNLYRRGIDMTFGSVPGDPLAMKSTEYFPDGCQYCGFGPAGGATANSGDIRVSGGQNIVSYTAVASPTIENGQTLPIIVCDSWDNSKLYLRAANYGTSGSVLQGGNGNGSTGSGGAAVWLSGFYNQIKDGITGWQVQYSALPGTSSGVGSECGTAQGPWYDTPEAVDAAANVADRKLADGSTLYPAVGRVRAFFIMPPPNGNDSVTNNSWTVVAVGQQVVAGQKEGTIIPNYASAKFAYSLGGSSTATLNQALAANGTWDKWLDSAYNPATNNGNTRGDRLTYTSASTRLSKQVTRLVWDSTLNGGKGAYTENGKASSSTSLVIAHGNGTPGDEALFTLQPTLTDATGVALESNKATVVVEDCLSDTMTYLSSTQSGKDLAPLVVRPGGTLPDEAEISCDLQHNSYIRFVLTDLVVNSTIDPILVLAQPSTLAQRDGNSYANNALTSSPADNSPANVRSASATVTFDTTAAVQLLKVAVAPTVQVNRADQNKKYEPMQWDITFLNRQSDTAGLRDVDIIDVLPANGLVTASGQSTTAFQGTLTLNDVQQTQGDGVQLFYTTADPASIKMDAADASNQPGGTTVWCDATGQIDPSKGASTGACPAGLTASPQTYAGVTGIRIWRPGDFKQADTITVQVTMTGVGNHKGDKYVNQAAGRIVAGPELPVGPIEAPVTVAGSSLGDTVWADINGNGLQDDGNDPGINGVKVTLTGTDDLGNDVKIDTETAYNSDTGKNGYYHFDNLRTPAGPDFYTLTFTKPDSAAVFSAQQVGGSSEAYIDSDVDTATQTSTSGQITKVRLEQNADDLTWDAGIYYKATVGDRVWQDVNGNGVQDSGEPNLAGVTVCISGNTGTNASIADVLGDKACVTTGTDGNYFFSVPPSGTDGYTVTFDASNVPGDLSGIKFTSTGQGDNIAEDSDAVVIDPDGNPLIGAVTGIVIESGKDNRDIDAGLVGIVTPAKSADPAEGSAVTAGETVTYTLTFTNDTPVGALVDYTDDMTALLDDANFNADTLTAGEGLTAAPAADGQSFTVTGSVPAKTTLTVTYTVTIKTGGDGVVGNWVYVTPGEDGDKPTPPDYSTPDGQETCLQDALCTVHFIGIVTPAKSAVPAEGSAVTAGETVTYTLTFTNDTPVGALVDYTDDMTALLDDANFNADTLTADEGLTATPAEDGQSFTVTGSVPANTTLTVTYTVTIKTGGDGVVGNWVYQTPGEDGDKPTPPDYSTTTGQADCLQQDALCTVHFIPSISVTKHGDVAKDAVVGSPVTWTVTVTNSGPVAVSSFVLTDNQMAPEDNFTWVGCTAQTVANGEVTIDGATIAAGEPITNVTLQPKEEIVCTGTSQVTQADIDQAGQTNPNVTVTAISIPPTPPSRWSGDWNPDSVSVKDQSTADVTLSQHADISLTKTVDKAEAALDDVVTFTVTAKNTGNTTLVNVTFDDPMDGLSDLNCTWPDADAPGTLLVDEEAVCTATYTITAADVANGGVKNVAAVTGYTPDIPNPDDPAGEPTPGAPVFATDDAAVTTLPAPTGPITPTDNAPTDTAPTGGYVAGNSAAGWLAVGLLLAVCGLMLGGAVVRRRQS